MADACVCAAVAAYNRPEALRRLLVSLAAQTRPLSVVVVDNASAQPLAPIVADAAARGLDVTLERLTPNTGSAGGFAAAIRTALAREPDWIWTFDDDAEPEPDALERLLESPLAGDPRAAVLASSVHGRAGIQVLHRGYLERRWLRPPTRAVSAADYDAGRPVKVDYSSWVGALIRAAAAREAGPPLVELFTRCDDLEYFERIGRRGELWLIPASRVRHHDDLDFDGESLLGNVRHHMAGLPFESFWRSAYTLRNTIYWGRRSGYVNAAGALLYLGLYGAKTLAFERDRPGLRLRLLAEYARQGWRGELVNVPPERWGELARARRPVRALAGLAVDHRTARVDPVAVSDRLE